MKIPSPLLLIIILSVSANCFAKEDMDTVIITAEEEKEENPSVQNSEILKEEIEALHSSSTAELVATVMGVKLSKLGNESQPSFISIRGSSPEQVLVLLNGKRLNSSQGGGVDLSEISVSSIKKIEVTRGGGSAIYGGSAFGGIINIITEGDRDEYIITKYGYSSGDSHKLSLTSSKYVTDSVFIASGINSVYSLGNFKYQGRDGEKERLNSDITSLSASINIDYSPTESINLFLYNFLYWADKGVPGLIEFPTKRARIEDLWLNSNIGLNYREFISFDFFIQKKERKYSNPDNKFGSLKDLHDYYSYSTLLSFEKSILYRELSLNGKADFSLSYDTLDSTAYTDSSKSERFNTYIFLSPRLEYKTFLFNPSFRADYQKKWGLLNSWNLGVKINLDSKDMTYLKGNFGNAYRLPSFDDMFWPETSFAVGNPGLEYEKGIIGDIGIISTFNSGFKIETTLFFHSIKDLIEWNPGPGGKWTPNNIGRAEMKGVEFETSYLYEATSLKGYFESRLNYSYLLALNKTNGHLYNKELINRSMHKGNFILIYRNFNHFTVSVDLSYTGDKYITSANTKIFPAYLLANINTTIPIRQHFKITGYIKNIFNHTYMDYRGFPIPGISAGIGLEYGVDFNE